VRCCSTISGDSVLYLESEVEEDGEDPGNPGSWNQYVYVVDDPINAGDPTGLDPICGPNGIWSGEGCYMGVAGSLPPPASAPSAYNPYQVFNSQGQQVNTGSMLGNWSTDLIGAYNQYVADVHEIYYLDSAQFAAEVAAFANVSAGMPIAEDALLNVPTCAGLFSLQAGITPWACSHRR
jgi:hypothetical protein